MHNKKGPNYDDQMKKAGQFSQQCGNNKTASSNLYFKTKKNFYFLIFLVCKQTKKKLMAIT